MSTADGPDVNDLDRGREVGPTAQISPKLAGCGCFGCSSLIVLAGCVALLVLVLGFLIPDWRANTRYVASWGVVLDKRVHSELFDVAGPKGQGVRKEESYRPEIKIRYEVGGRKFETWGYDATGIYSRDRAAQQAIVNSFQVGAMYPCWYDPDRPERAILVRGHVWGAYAFLIVPLGLFAVGGAGMWLARAIASAPPVPTAPGEGLPQAPTVARFIQGLHSSGTLPGAFKPSQFGDPLAVTTEWSPIKGVGGNLQTRKLVEVDADRLAFRETTGGVVFALAFLLTGVLASAVLVKDIVSRLALGNLNINGFAGLPFTLLFAAAGGYMLYWWTTPIVFDRRRGMFWKGRAATDEWAEEKLPSNATNFGAIHALQLISFISAGRTRSRCYEMNLVMTGGERLHVVGYASGRQKQFREDAAVLAEFLGKPVWDAL